MAHSIPCCAVQPQWPPGSQSPARTGGEHASFHAPSNIASRMPDHKRSQHTALRHARHSRMGVRLRLVGPSPYAHIHSLKRLEAPRGLSHKRHTPGLLRQTVVVVAVQCTPPPPCVRTRLLRRGLSRSKWPTRCLIPRGTKPHTTTQSSARSVF